MSDLAHLGAALGPPRPVSGGFRNRTFRLDTVRGSFAVKRLDPAGGAPAARPEDVLRFERAAFDAGVPMPEPVSADARTVVHRWVEGDVVPEEPVAPAFGAEVGAMLARIHSLRYDGVLAPLPSAPSTDWAALSARARATGQPWADELAATVDDLLAIARSVDGCVRPGPVVVTHRDVQPWNLLAVDGRPVLLDWELSGRLDLAAELGSTALALSKGRGPASVDAEVFRAVVHGYAAAGGTVPPPGPNWFVFTVGAWLEHTRSNVLRCLTGAGDLALAHAVVEEGLRGLPELHRRLPELEAALLHR